MCSFNLKMYKKPFSTIAPPRTSLDELMTLPRLHNRRGRTPLPILLPHSFREGAPSARRAQAPHGRYGGSVGR